MAERKEHEGPEGRKPARLRRLAAVAAVLTGLLLLSLTGIAAICYRNTITPSGIVIHHSAVPPPLDGSPLDIRWLDEIHRQRGYQIFYWGRFYHVGYHYVILPDGTVQAGRPEHCRGAHATGYNSYIGICLIGDFSTEDNPTGTRGPKEPTASQIRALAELTARLSKRYGIPLDHVVQHHDVNPNTECPGDRFPFSQFIEQLRELEAVQTH